MDRPVGPAERGRFAVAAFDEEEIFRGRKKKVQGFMDGWTLEIWIWLR